MLYAGYTMFRDSVKGTGYPLHSSVSLSLPLPCVTVCYHISNWTPLQFYHADGSSRLLRNVDAYHTYITSNRIKLSPLSIKSHRAPYTKMQLINLNIEK